MKIFLTAINAKYIHSNLAVYSLRAYAKDYQDQIVIGEYTINNRVDYILEQIYKAKPDVLCFSCYIWIMDYVEELITEYHKLCPEVPIWVGGPEVSYEVETFLLYRKFLKSSEIVYNRLEIKNDITKERRGLRHDVVYEVFCFGLG